MVMRQFRSPMLAKNFEGHEGDIQYPCFIQPKLDGVRCVTNGRQFWSRNGNPFPPANFHHLQTTQFPALIDGELTLREGGDFEEIVSVVKRNGHPDRGRIIFNAFDLITLEPYAQRRMELRLLLEHAHPEHWNCVETRLVVNAKMLHEFHARFLDRGYEGSIIRSAMGRYSSKRTVDLLKWKPLKDAEFEIVDVKEARGKDKHTPVFICCVGLPKDNVLFRARPMGTIQQRRKMWRDRHDLLGCMLTVEYQNLTKYGVPRFPRAKVLRDYE